MWCTLPVPLSHHATPTPHHTQLFVGGECIGGAEELLRQGTPSALMARIMDLACVMKIRLSNGDVHYETFSLSCFLGRVFERVAELEMTKARQFRPFALRPPTDDIPLEEKLRFQTLREIGFQQYNGLCVFLRSPTEEDANSETLWYSAPQVLQDAARAAFLPPVAPAVGASAVKPASHGFWTQEQLWDTVKLPMITASITMGALLLWRALSPSTRDSGSELVAAPEGGTATPEVPKEEKQEQEQEQEGLLDMIPRLWSDVKKR